MNIIFDHKKRLKAFNYSNNHQADNFLSSISQNDIIDKINDFSKVNFSKTCELLSISNKISDYFKFPISDHYGFTEEEIIKLEPDCYDLIYSCLNMHKINDLPKFLFQVKHLLNNKGVFIGSLIGGSSLNNLKIQLANLDNRYFKVYYPRIAPMIDHMNLSLLAKKIGFNSIITDSKIIKAEYSDITNVFNDLKIMGEKNIMSIKGRPNLNRKMLKELDESLKCSDKITIDYELIYISCWK